MRLPRFQLLQPKSIEQAAEFLSQHETAAKVMAGGTDILPRMKYGLESPEFLISLSGLPARKPQDSDGTLLLDSLMTLNDAARDEIIRKNALVLAEAAHAVGSYQIRNMGTLGGNLCQESRCLYYNQKHGYQFMDPCFKRNGDRCYAIAKGRKCMAVFMADTAPALFSLDASVQVLSSGSLTRIPIDRFYTGDPLHPIALSKNQLLVGIAIPKASGLRGTAFSKFTIRGGLEFAAISAAVVLDVREDGSTCSRARLTVGAVSAAPIRLKKTESILTGQRLSADVFNVAAQTAADEISPIPHHGYSASYLKACLKSLSRDALASAYNRIA